MYGAVIVTGFLQASFNYFLKNQTYLVSTVNNWVALILYITPNLRVICLNIGIATDNLQ